MNTKKHPSSDKLQKSSILFLQLGLVLALFIVYGALEFETVKNEYNLPKAALNDPDPLLIPDKAFTIEKKVEKTIPEKHEKLATDTFTKTPDDEPMIEDVMKPEDDDKVSVDDLINNIPETNTPPEDLDDIPFPILEDAPIFPGCEGLEKEASKECFTKEISKFVNKKFDTGLADGLSLQGKQKIWVQFKIDKNGNVVDITARAPHKKLEKEAIRIIHKLPQMTPGMQRKRPVSVKYTLPISFEIQ